MEKKDLAKLSNEELLAAKKRDCKIKTLPRNVYWFSSRYIHIWSCFVESPFFKTSGIFVSYANPRNFHIQTAHIT
ncbi:MAG: hypothetical protein ACK5OS_04370 [Chryseotalea sp.]